jgi:hypothetical protein
MGHSPMPGKRQLLAAAAQTRQIARGSPPPPLRKRQPFAPPSKSTAWTGTLDPARRAYFHAYRAQRGQAMAYLTVMRARAQQRGVPCTVSELELITMLRKTRKCPVLRIPLRIGGVRGRLVTDDLATFDAFEPDKGYVSGNVFVLSHRANRLKNDATLAEIAALHKWMKRPH